MPRWMPHFLCRLVARLGERRRPEPPTRLVSHHGHDRMRRATVAWRTADVAAEVDRLSRPRGVARVPMQRAVNAGRWD